MNFMQKTYTNLKFEIFEEVAIEAFSKAWFSFQIYNSKEGKISLTPSMADSVSTTLRTEGLQAKQELVDLRVAVGNILNVKKALMWIECWLMNLIGYEGWFAYKAHLKIGLVVV